MQSYFNLCITIRTKNHQYNPPQLQIANIETDMCLDSAAKPDDMQGAVDPYKCHGQGGNQVLLLFLLCFSFNIFRITKNKSNNQL